MKIALDPYMIRHEPLDRLPHAVAELGYDQIELSPRSDFLDWQRRQASLVAQGWRVIRFANVDVRDNALRCAELLGLLLRDV